MNNSFRVTFIVISIIQINIYIKNNHFITRKYSITRILILHVRNQLISNINKCKKTFFKCFVTHFLSLEQIQSGTNSNRNQEQILLNDKYWQLYHTFFESYIYQENIFLFLFLKKITKSNFFLTACLQTVLLLRWSLTFPDFSLLYQYSYLMAYRFLYYIHYQPS